MYQYLLKSFKHFSNVIISDYALSDCEATSSFQYVVSNPGYSGMLKRHYYRPREVVQEIAVRTNLLDNLIPEHVSIKFIKVDVEGAELQVFKGAVKTLKRNRPVMVFEHGLGAADCYSTVPEQIFDLLHCQCGLNLFLMCD